MVISIPCPVCCPVCDATIIMHPASLSKQWATQPHLHTSTLNHKTAFLHSKASSDPGLHYLQRKPNCLQASPEHACGTGTPLKSRKWWGAGNVLQWTSAAIAPNPEPQSLSFPRYLEASGLFLCLKKLPASEEFKFHTHLLVNVCVAESPTWGFCVTQRNWLGDRLGEPCC